MSEEFYYKPNTDLSVEDSFCAVLKKKTIHQNPDKRRRLAEQLPDLYFQAAYQKNEIVIEAALSATTALILDSDKSVSYTLLKTIHELGPDNSALFLEDLSRSRAVSDLGSVEREELLENLFLFPEPAFKVLFLRHLSGFLGSSVAGKQPFSAFMGYLAIHEDPQVLLALCDNIEAVLPHVHEAKREDFVLILAGKPRYPNVRLAVADRLDRLFLYFGPTGSESPFIHALRDLLNDQDSSVQQAAQNSLSRLQTGDQIIISGFLERMPVMKRGDDFKPAS